MSDSKSGTAETESRESKGKDSGVADARGASAGDQKQGGNTEGENQNQESNSDSSDDDTYDPNDKFSDEEIAWSKRYFKSEKYAKFFKICSELKISNNEEQLLEMKLPRKWVLKVRTARFSNFQGLNDYFLNFYVGYNMQARKKRAPKSTKKSVGKDGKPLHRKYVWHTTGTQGISFTSPVLKYMNQGETRDFPGFNVRVRACRHSSRPACSVDSAL